MLAKWKRVFLPSWTILCQRRVIYHYILVVMLVKMEMFVFSLVFQELERLPLVLSEIDTLLAMINMFGLIRVSLTWKEDAMLSVLVLLNKSNQKFLTLLSLVQFWKMLPWTQSIRKSTTLILQLLKIPELAIHWNSSKMSKFQQ